MNPRSFPRAILCALLLSASSAHAVWTKTAYPAYMTATCLLEVSPGIMWAGSAANGIQSTRDGGATWTRVSTPWGYSHPVPAMARGAQSVIFVTNGMQVSASLDQGATWSAPTTPLILDGVRTLAVDSIWGILYAGGVNGVCESPDVGKTWSHKGPIDETVNTIHISAVGRIYLGCAGVQPGLGGLYISDPVSTWSFIGSMYADVTGMTITGGKLFVGITNSKGGNLIGTDYLNGVGTFYSFSKGIPDGAAVRALGLAKDGALWSGLDRGAYRSTDGGKNWSMAGLDTLKVTAFGIAGDRLYAGTQAQGVYRFSAGDSRILDPRNLLREGGGEGGGGRIAPNKRLSDALGRNFGSGSPNARYFGRPASP